MDFLTDDFPPVGMTRYEEMLNILVGLVETGGCDRRTLRIVAQSVGIRSHFDREVGRLDAQAGGVVVERPVYLLDEVTQ